MSALPVLEPDPDDPVEILRVLPSRFHEQFLAEVLPGGGSGGSAGGRLPATA